MRTVATSATALAIALFAVSGVSCGDDEKLRKDLQDLESDRSTHLREIENLESQLEKCRDANEKLEKRVENAEKAVEEAAEAAKKAAEEAARKPPARKKR